MVKTQTSRLRIKIPIAQRLFHAVGKIRGYIMFRAFKSDARHANAVNLKTLREIVEANKDTEFGRLYNFADMDLSKNGKDFADNVPLQSYDDLAPYVQRMAAGEANILCAEPPVLFAMSSGTSGTPKLVPTTESLAKTQVRYYGGIIPAVVNQQIPGGSEPHLGTMLISGTASGMKTSCGTRIDSSSSAGVVRMKKLMPFLWTSPFEAYTVADRDACWYLHALFALREPQTKFVTTAFSPTLVNWFAMIEAKWESLLDDIAHGTIADNVNLTTWERDNLARHLRSDSERAEELQKAVEAGFKNFVLRIWPHIKYVGCIITGSFAAYVPNLRYYIKDLLIYTTVYLASEAMLGINLWPDKPEHYAMCIGSAVFEFIPVENVDDEFPETVEMDALEVGKEYELVVTNLAGFHRYRLTDIVRVVDFFYELPVISFSYRRGGLLDLVGERLTTSHTLNAVQLFVENWGGEDALLVDYTVARDTDSVPPRYVFYVEVDRASPDKVVEAWQVMEDALLETCHSYKLYARGQNQVNPPMVKIMCQKAFEALCEYRLQQTPGSSRNQIKTPRVLTNDKYISFLEKHVEIESSSLN